MKTIAPQLKNYRWKGINSSGKKTSGNVLAMTEVEVRERLDA
ncbi:type II secretion system F family protein, partial [Vibrio campbellii]